MCTSREYCHVLSPGRSGLGVPASRPRLARTWASGHEDWMPPSLLGPVSWRPVWELLPPPVLAGASCRRPPWGAGHRGSWGKDPVPRALRPPPRREWRGCPAWRLRRRPVVALGDSGEARHRLTVSGVPGGTGARAPGVAGHTSPDVPSGPGPGFESQPHAPTWKAVGPPWAHLCLGGRQPSLPSWGRQAGI